ncbi:hypothetical protein [Stenotrophomonas geniculata]|jgi:hypothetical protein|uniref:hypothetical protein n=1 Tax=Stenotrophomonas geniculata TaxID=86188 RepID=UPI002E782967|nr:hypothetical protein [Stenotrophomonas geniculata]
MVWWKGFSTCSQLGVNDCVVWWSAWSVAVGIFSAFVALFGAAAVAYLAWQANRQAKTAHDNLANHTQRELKEKADSAVRKERVILCYLRSELDTIEIWSRNLLKSLEDENNAALDRYSTELPVRQKMSDGVKDIRLPKMDAMLPSFHECSPGIAARLARTLGTFEVVRFSLTRNAGWASRTPGSTKAKIKSWRSVHRVLLENTKIVHEDALYCTREARRQMKEAIE